MHDFNLQKPQPICTVFDDWLYFKITGLPQMEYYKAFLFCWYLLVGFCPVHLKLYLLHTGTHSHTVCFSWLCRYFKLKATIPAFLHEVKAINLHYFLGVFQVLLDNILLWIHSLIPVAVTLIEFQGYSSSSSRKMKLNVFLKYFY